MDMRTTAIYARQSVDKKDSLSIEGQIELCAKEAAGSEFAVYRDRGFSGKNTNRPDFSRLMKDVSVGRISKIICYRLDRISRSILDFGQIWDALSKNGVEFVSVNEKFDTSTPVGRAMLYIIMVFAQLERETIAERIKDNYYQRAKRGMWPGGPAPFGFEILKEKGRGAVLSPTEALKAVPRIFEMYAGQGTSLGNVCGWLNENGIPCSKRDRWDTVSLNRLLRHPAYVSADATVYAYYKGRGVVPANGIEEFDGTSGAIIVGKRNSGDRKFADLSHHVLALCGHKGVVSSRLFLRCQHKLDSNRQIGNGGKGQYTWLSGLLKCAGCGYGLKVQNDKKSGRLFLVCSGKSNLKLCDYRHSERLEDVESLVLDKAQKYLAGVKGSRKSSEAGISEANASLAVIDEKINNLISSLAEASGVSMKYINAELSRLETQKDEIMKKLPLLAGGASELSDMAHIDFSALSFVRKKMIARLLIDRIHVGAEGIDIKWKS